MMSTVIVSIILFIVFAPIIGGLINGLDRVLTAKVQARFGPPILQPFYDVFKLLGKEKLAVNKFHGDYMVSFLIFVIASGALLFGGSSLLLVIFCLMVAQVFLVLSAYSTNSPYALIGAERELIQMLAAEPMMLLAAVGLYYVVGSFHVYNIAKCPVAPIIYLPGVFIGLAYVFTIKLRKSPFDLATSHHAHQELVKGLTTEFAGPTLAYFEIAHWYETIILLAIFVLFFGKYWLLGIITAIILYLIEILIDNINARIKWELMLISSWLVTIILGIGNLLVIFFLFHI